MKLTVQTRIQDLVFSLEDIYPEAMLTLDYLQHISTKEYNYLLQKSIFDILYSIRIQKILERRR